MLLTESNGLKYDDRTNVLDVVDSKELHASLDILWFTWQFRQRFLQNLGDTLRERTRLGFQCHLKEPRFTHIIPDSEKQKMSQSVIFLDEKNTYPSGSRTMTFAPLFSATCFPWSLFNQLKAPLKELPELPPTSSPSRRISFLTASNASVSEVLSQTSTDSRSSTSGTKSYPIPSTM